MSPPTLIVDANVLIDYLETDISILSLVSRHLGPVCVATPVLREVLGLDASECEDLGIAIIEPTLEEALQARSRERGGPSFQDRICLAIARHRGFICATNDKGLRRACGAAGVEVQWGLELAMRLVQGGHLPSEDARAIARQMREPPPSISASVLAAFELQLDELVD